MFCKRTKLTSKSFKKILAGEALLKQSSDQTELPAGKFQNGILLSFTLRPFIKKDPAVPFLFAQFLRSMFQS